MSNDTTLIPKDEYLAMMAFIPEDIFYSDNEVKIGDRTYYRLTVREYQSIRGRFEAYRAKNAKLNRCSDLNTKGIELERSGDISGAVKVYEENISGDCYPATHSFDRLCVIYRRAKDYRNEIRVLEKACMVFTLDKYKTRLAKAKELQAKSSKL